MERTGITKIACPYFELAIVNNPVSVVVDDEQNLPSDYITVKTVKSPNKKAIKEAIDSGEDVPGAHLTRTTRLRIK
jgi:hypothetical protein